LSFHKDILPYDDDADILINVKYFPSLARLSAMNTTATWQMYVKSRHNFKFFFRESPSAGGYPWNWPFIGIQLFLENETHIYADHLIDKKHIYPLVLRPIAGLWLPGPRHVHEYLNDLPKSYFLEYSIDKKCMMKAYSHHHEVALYEERIIDCEQLHNVYPYIRRSCEKNFCYEYFMLDSVPFFIF